MVNESGKASVLLVWHCWSWVARPSPALTARQTLEAARPTARPHQ